jgi:hypothetical protein
MEREVMWKQIYGTASFKYGKVPIKHNLVLFKFHDKALKTTLYRLWDMEDIPQFIASFKTLKDANAFTAEYLSKKADANEKMWRTLQSRISLEL